MRYVKWRQRVWAMFLFLLLRRPRVGVDYLSEVASKGSWNVTVFISQPYGELSFFVCLQTLALLVCLLFFLFPTLSVQDLGVTYIFYYEHGGALSSLWSLCLLSVDCFGGLCVRLLLDVFVDFGCLAIVWCFCPHKAWAHIVLYFIPFHPHGSLPSSSHLSETASRGLWNVICSHITAFWWAF